MGKDKRKNKKGLGKLKEKIEKIKQDMVSDYIIAYENKYKKEPSQDVIDRMYERANKIVNKNVRRFGIKIAAVVSLIGITGVGFLSQLPDDTKALPEGQQKEEKKEDEKEISKYEAFRGDMIVETEEQKIAKEIDELESVQDVDAYLNNIYIEQYEKKTGDTELKTSDIQIDESSQNYAYVLDDGQIVTHGKLPAETEKLMKADGEKYTTTDDELKIYTVRTKEDGKIIDAVTKLDFEKVIAGDNYKEMKEGYESTLTGIKEITKTAFRLKELIEEIERNPDDNNAKSVCEYVREKLAEEVIKFNEQNESKTVENNEIKVEADKDMEIGE